MVIDTESIKYGRGLERERLKEKDREIACDKK
jgi:hypothetical protein